jgi:hypothetical protein
MRQRARTAICHYVEGLYTDSGATPASIIRALTRSRPTTWPTCMPYRRECAVARLAPEELCRAVEANNLSLPRGDDWQRLRHIALGQRQVGAGRTVQNQALVVDERQVEIAPAAQVESVAQRWRIKRRYQVPPVGLRQTRAPRGRK